MSKPPLAQVRVDRTLLEKYVEKHPDLKQFLTQKKKITALVDLMLRKAVESDK